MLLISIEIAAGLSLPRKAVSALTFPRQKKGRIQLLSIS